MRQAVIQIGDFTATFTAGVDEFSCPGNPKLEFELNDYYRSIRGYWPDRLAHYAEAVAAKFNGTILRLDRLILPPTSDSSILH